MNQRLDMHGCPVPPPLSRAEMLRPVLYLAAVLAVFFGVVVLLGALIPDIGSCWGGCETPD